MSQSSFVSQGVVIILPLKTVEKTNSQSTFSSTLPSFEASLSALSSSFETSARNSGYGGMPVHLPQGGSYGAGYGGMHGSAHSVMASRFNPMASWNDSNTVVSGAGISGLFASPLMDGMNGINGGHTPSDYNYNDAASVFGGGDYGNSGSISQSQWTLNPTLASSQFVHSNGIDGGHTGHHSDSSRAHGVEPSAPHSSAYQSSACQSSASQSSACQPGAHHHDQQNTSCCCYCAHCVQHGAHHGVHHSAHHGARHGVHHGVHHDVHHGVQHSTNSNPQ